MAGSATSRSEGTDLAHDFNNEHLKLMVMGGYVVLKNNPTYFALNVIYLGIVLLVYIYLIVMAVVTIVHTTYEKVIMVQAIQTLCLLLVGIALPGAKLLTDGKLDLGLQMLREGVHNYLGEVEDEEYDQIRKKHVEQIRNLMAWVSKLCFCCAFSNTFFIPLVRQLSNQETTSQSLLNPNLPLPLYVPFNTRTTYGYSIAFLTNAIFFFFLYATINSLIETYLSCSLQLIAQLEILNYSITTIQKRAYLKLYKNRAHNFLGCTEDLFKNEEFQRHLYLCMRENVLHHQAILRLTKAVSPFLEIINSICILSFSIVLAASIILILENPTLNVALISTLTSDIYCYYEMCRVGQVITDKSIEVAQSLNSTPWPECSEEFKGLLKTMIPNTQRPIVIKATGFNASASLGTYADMMTLGYKIMNVLRR